MRRGRLLSTVSRRILIRSLPRPDPAIERITQVVRAISTLVTQQNLVGFDFRDLRAVLRDGGRAVFAEGHDISPTGRRPR